MRRFSKFAVVGAIGFLADSAAFLLLQSIVNLPAFVDRAISITAALVVTWLLNRHFTFGRSDRPLLHEGARYWSVGIATSLFNYFVFVAIIAALPQLNPLVALAISSLCAMALSFSGYSRLVFSRS